MDIKLKSSKKICLLIARILLNQCKISPEQHHLFGRKQHQRRVVSRHSNGIERIDIQVYVAHEFMRYEKQAYIEVAIVDMPRLK